MNSLFSNISCSFLQKKNLNILRTAKYYVFRVFLEIMKTELKYPVAVTPSILHSFTIICVVLEVHNVNKNA